MIDLGLTPAGRRALIRTLASEHVATTRCSILDMNHRHLGALGRITSGQVNIDARAEVTRQLQMTYIDDGSRSVRVNYPSGEITLNRMVRAYYVVRVEDEALDDWVHIPVFTGPITNVSRDGEVVTLEAMGKEFIANSPTWRSASYPKGANRVATVRKIMRDLTGETRFSFPEGWTSRTSRIITMGKEDPAWKQAKATANSARGQLFYDGRGTLRLRSRPTRSAFTFRDGNGGTLLSLPKVEEDSFDAVNTVKVVGAVPVGKKNPATHTEYLPREHPYSPWSMERGGKNQYLPEVISDDTLRSQRAVEGVAKWRIREIELDEKLVKFDALPMPLMEELDPFTIDAEDVKVTSRMSQMTIPLVREGQTTIGYLARVPRTRR